ncbi:hypothetical protein [Tardiphaga sp. P5_C7]
MDWDSIIKVGAGLLTGGLAMKVFDWWTAKKKEDKQRRRDQIAKWRTWLATLPDNGGWSCEGEVERAIMRSAEFQSIETYLDTDLLTRMRKQRSIMVGFDIHPTLSKRISELEKQWRLT